MKQKIRMIALLCVCCMLLSSCSMLGKGSKDSKDSKETMKTTETTQAEKKSETADQKQTQTQTDPKAEKLSSGKKAVDANSVRKISLNGIVNKGIYTGFTKKQEAMLEKNGFVIMEPNFEQMAYLKMHMPYEHLDYTNDSVIITTDAVLHMWHVFYSESMKALEMIKYLPNLEEISLEMENKAIEAYQSAPDAL